jgi:ketosteroid isomerase-like protein
MRMMKVIKTVALSSMLIALPVLPAPAVKADDDTLGIKEQIIRLQNEEDRALLRGDFEALDRFWADDLLYPNDNGEVLTKTQRLAEVRAQTHNFSIFRHDDIRVHVYNGTTAVVTGYSTTLKKYKGHVSRGPRRFSAVWIKRDGRWQMVAHQRTDASRQ